MAVPPPCPSVSQPLVDATGLITTSWYQYLLNLRRSASSGSSVGFLGDMAMLLGRVQNIETSLLPSAKSIWYNVRDYGAKGDGVTDDSAAVAAANAAVVAAKTGMLYFPPGQYRYANTAPLTGASYFPDDTVAAILFVGISNIGVRMDPGAVLIMDTANSQRGGILILGPCSNITLDGVNIAWKDDPSLGPTPSGNNGNAGVEILGDTTVNGQWSLSQVYIVNGLRVTNAPMWGMRWNAVWYAEVDSVIIDHSARDGIHLYACRDVMIDRVLGYRTGDDVLAFDNQYYVPGTTAPYPYLLNISNLFSPWASGGCSVNTIVADSCAANALTLLGAYGVTVGKIYQFHDSPTSSGWALNVASWPGVPAGQIAYAYPASRRISIGSIRTWNSNGPINVTSSVCSMDTTATPPGGIVYPGSSADFYSSNYWKHDIRVGETFAHDLPTGSGGNFTTAILLQTCAGISIGDTEVRISPFQTVGVCTTLIRCLTVQDISFGNIVMEADGSATVTNSFFLQAFTGNAGIPVENQLFNNITIKSITTIGCSGYSISPIDLFGLRGGNIGPLLSESPSGPGVYIASNDIDIPKIQVFNSNRSNGTSFPAYAAVILQGNRVRIRSILIAYHSVGIGANFVSIYVPNPLTDSRIDDLQIVSNSTTGAQANLGGGFSTSSIAGAWYDTTTGARGGIAYGRGTYGFPLCLQNDNGDLIYLSADTSNNLRYSHQAQGTVFPTSTSQGSALALASSLVSSGTWVPVLLFGGTMSTLASKFGYYVNIGGIIWVSFGITLGAIASSGAMTISGLPVSASSNNGNNLGWLAYTHINQTGIFGQPTISVPSVPFGPGTIATPGQMFAGVTGTSIVVQGIQNNNTGTAAVSDADMVSGSSVFGSFWYSTL